MLTLKKIHSYLPVYQKAQHPWESGLPHQDLQSMYRYNTTLYLCTVIFYLVDGSFANIV